MEQGLKVFNFTAESLESLFASQGVERRAKSGTLSDLILFETCDEKRQEKLLRLRNDFDLDERFSNLNSYKFAKRGCEIVYGLTHPQLDIDTIDYQPPFSGGDGSNGSSPEVATKLKRYQKKYMIALKVEARTANGTLFDRHINRWSDVEKSALKDHIDNIVVWLEEFTLGKTTQAYKTRSAWMYSETGEPVFLECSADVLCSSSEIDLFREARANAARREQSSTSLANGNSYEKGHTMGIQAAEISAILRDQIKNFGRDAEVDEVGRVLSVGEGIARIYGLGNVQAGEMVEFPGGIRGMALSLEADNVGIVIFGSDRDIKEGDIVKRTNAIVNVPAGDAVLGRVVGGLGNPLDCKGTIEASERRLAGVKAHSVIPRKDRATGLKAVIQTGRSHRELIIGNLQTGKTVLALEAMLNQEGSNEAEGDDEGKKPYCMNVAINDKCSIMAQLVKKLKENGAMENSIIVAAIASVLALVQFLARYPAITIAEYFRDNGSQPLIIYGDPSKQAVSFRLMSIRVHHSARCEAYLDDVFHTYSRFLERSVKLNQDNRVGSQTALPIIETQSNAKTDRLRMLLGLADNTGGSGAWIDVSSDTARGHSTKGDGNDAAGHDSLWKLLGIADKIGGSGARIDASSDTARGHSTKGDGNDAAGHDSLWKLLGIADGTAHGFLTGSGNSDWLKEKVSVDEMV